MLDRGRGINGNARRSTYLAQLDQQSSFKKPGCGIISLALTVLFVIFAMPALSSNGKASRSEIVPNMTPLVELNSHPTSFRLLAITDLDSQSRVGVEGKSFHSILLEGNLYWDEHTEMYKVNWGESQKLHSGHNEAGRGMELSELVVFNGHLYTMDDRTGILFEIIKSQDGKYHVSPKQLMVEGDGTVDKGMKVEWATVKDDELFIGSFGKEYTNSAGEIVSTSNNWVVIYDKDWKVDRYDWTEYYQLMREATGTKYPGYMIHEAANWSPVMKKWVFLPRRVSSEPYDETSDETKGSNKLIIIDESFSEVEVREAGVITPERGFSSFKFVPGSQDQVIVALKSEERSSDNIQNSFITVFDLDGHVLLEESELPGHAKFEGLAIWAL